MFLWGTDVQSLGLVAHPPSQSHLTGCRVPEKKPSLAAPEKANGQFFFLPREKQLLIDLHSRPRTPSHPPTAKLLLISLLDKLASGLALALEVWRRRGDTHWLGLSWVPGCCWVHECCEGRCPGLRKGSDLSASRPPGGHWSAVRPGRQGPGHSA